MLFYTDTQATLIESNTAIYKDLRCDSSIKPTDSSIILEGSVLLEGLRQMLFSTIGGVSSGVYLKEHQERPDG